MSATTQFWWKSTCPCTSQLLLSGKQPSLQLHQRDCLSDSDWHDVSDVSVDLFDQSMRSLKLSEINTIGAKKPIIKATCCWQKRCWMALNMLGLCKHSNLYTNFCFALHTNRHVDHWVLLLRSRMCISCVILLMLNMQWSWQLCEVRKDSTHMKIPFSHGFPSRSLVQYPSQSPK